MLKSARNGLEQEAMELGLPACVMGSEMVEITGNQQVLLSGNKGIRSYSEKEIAVEMRSLTVVIRGSGLSIVSMSGQELLIRGCISEIHYLR